MGRGDLSDKECVRLEPHLPKNAGRGGRWKSHRRVINGILLRQRTGIPWRTCLSNSASGRPFTTGIDAGQPMARGTGFCGLSRLMLTRGPHRLVHGERGLHGVPRPPARRPSPSIHPSHSRTPSAPRLTPRRRSPGTLTRWLHMQDPPGQRRRPTAARLGDHTGPVGRCPATDRGPGPHPRRPARRRTPTDLPGLPERRQVLQFTPRSPLPAQTPDQAHHPRNPGTSGPTVKAGATRAVGPPALTRRSTNAVTRSSARSTDSGKSAVGGGAAAGEVQGQGEGCLAGHGYVQGIPCRGRSGDPSGLPRPLIRHPPPYPRRTAVA
ncbi:hypothetical protein SAFG77S_08427 [Streptomyces afghaniensis]